MVDKILLYDYQKQVVRELLNGKRIVQAGCGLGKTAMAIVWAEQEAGRTGKKKLLVVTTASKAKTNDWQDEADLFAPDLKGMLDEFTIISWHKFAAWQKKHIATGYIIIYDEVQRSKNGVSSGMGRAFLKANSNCTSWIGLTGTPGDSWIQFYPYFVATNKVKNKTEFVRNFCEIQTYRGFPEIKRYYHEDILRKWWSEISYSPDTSVVESQLPSETHKVIKFSTPPNYKKVLTTRKRLDNGEMIDNISALTHYLRQLCFTKDKEEWVRDFITDTGEPMVMFFNYTSTADKVQEIAEKALPKGARVWRIDGSHHEIPTAETIGDRDIVLCQWQSGSEALNLQYLHIWVSLEPHYAYSTSVQARGRIRRLGQQKHMVYLYLECDKAIEGDVYEILRNKGEFSAKNWAIKNNLIKENK